MEIKNDKRQYKEYIENELNKYEKWLKKIQRVYWKWIKCNWKIIKDNTKSILKMN